MQDIRLSAHKHASQAYSANLPAVVLQLLFQIFLRLIALSPMILAVVTGRFFQVRREHAVAVALLASLPLYVLIVLPFRFHFFAKLARYLGYERDDRAANYLTWLSASLYRLLRALPFLLPLFAYAVLFYYNLRVVDFPSAMLSIEKVGAVFGGSYPVGIGVILLAALLVFLLALYGWRRYRAFEHQPVIELGIPVSWRHTGQLHQARRPRFAHVSRVNALLCLPGIVAMAGVLALFFGQSWMGNLMMDFFSIVERLLNLDFPETVFYQLLIVLIVFYLPLLPLRKLAASAVSNEA
ncbi:MAG: hypothetical protein GX124_00855 [Clostridiales bacterium]|jgi:hypothetical protein|nr:hypothetical protein [Clostridiales bacterium]